MQLVENGRHYINKKLIQKRESGGRCQNNTKDEVGGGAMHTASIFLHLCLRLVSVTSSLYVYTLCVGFGTRF